MAEDLAKSIAKLHAFYNVVPLALFDVPANLNIVARIAEIKELGYLREFYEAYEAEYRKAEIGEVQPLEGVARSVDLPFVGECTVNSGKAKYIFVFEGALSPPERLSNTVLSCLWPLEGFRQVQSIFSTFWPTTFFNIVECLGISVDIARKSYAVDGVRIGNPDGNPDIAKNRALLYKEIELLDPTLVILVGRVAANIVGRAALTAKPELYFQVPFPSNRRSRARAKADIPRFEALQKRLSELELESDSDSDDC